MPLFYSDNTAPLISHPLILTKMRKPRASVILSPLRLASLTHKNPQRRKIVHGMSPLGLKDRSIDLNMRINFVEISCSCSFCGSYYGCYLTMHTSFSLCCALK